ncbi:MAG: hypothetical protein Tsb009_15980 [Planctomycetaceae bacterium]
MQFQAKTILMPVLLIVVGTGWLLTVTDVMPGIDWIWTLGLAAAGVLAVTFSGIDKFSVVVGPFFISASLLSVARQTNRISFDIEVPILVIILGVLMLIAHHRSIPTPEWVIREMKKEKERSDREAP